MKQIHHKRLPQGSGEQSALLLLSVAFVLGGLFAFFLASSVSGSGSEALSAYITDFLGALRDDALQKPGLWATLWSVFRWPLLVVIFSLGRFGLFGIPAVFFLRGFLFSFCISTFAQTLGRQGLLFALMLLGVESLLSIPVLFVLGTQGLFGATRAKRCRQGAKQATGIERRMLLCGALCLAVLLFCTLWELVFLPLLLSGAAKSLPLP